MNSVTSKIRIDFNDEDLFAKSEAAVCTYINRVSGAILKIFHKGNVIVAVYTAVKNIGIDIFGHVKDARFVKYTQRNLFSYVAK